MTPRDPTPPPGGVVETAGPLGALALGGLVVRVRVVGTVRQFGRLDLLVTPVAGSGTIRVHAARVQLDDNPAPPATA